MKTEQKIRKEIANQSKIDKYYNSNYSNPNPNSDGLKNLREKFNTKPQNMGEIYTACKYWLPCGRCELTKEMCSYYNSNYNNFKYNYTE